MAEQITVRFEFLGIETQLIESYSLKSDFTTPADGWNLTIFDPDIIKIPRFELQPIEILINGSQQVLGRVDVVTTGGGEGTAIQLQGRDFFGDMVACHVDPSIKIKKEMSLETVIKQAAGPVGITEVLEDAELLLRNTRMGKRAPLQSAPEAGLKSKKADEYKANPGEGIYQFLNRIVARFGATMQPGVKRTQVVLTTPNYAQDPSYTITRRLPDVAGKANNIISATATQDWSTYPTHTLFTGKQGRGGKKKTATSLSDGITQGRDADDPLLQTERQLPGSVTDSGKLYRLLYRRDQQSRDQAQLERAWLRALAEQLKKTLRYSVKLRNHTDNDVNRRLFAVDTMIQVNDEVCGINERLWVASRSFDYSPGEGPTTTLECWRPGTFIL